LIGRNQSSFIMLVGILVGANLAIAKFAVLNGVSPLAALYWTIIGASVVLLTLIRLRGEKIPLDKTHLCYYMIGGILGVTGPQLLSNFVLQKIPASLFTVLVTLSPLATFILTSIFERKWLPAHRLAGVLIGFAGILLATNRGLDFEEISGLWLVMAFSVPVLLGMTNLYRNKAYPAGSPPLPLAAGTLMSQILILSPIFWFSQNRYVPFAHFEFVDLAVLSLALITALAYIITYELQRHTDGLGFSQVGYFVTLTGVVLGIVVFDEPLTLGFFLSVILLFTGLAVSNGHISLPRFNTKSGVGQCS